MLTIVAFTLAGTIWGKLDFWDWHWIGFAVLLSWPGYLVFLFFGIPTLYVLYRLRQASYLAFVSMGVFWTFLPAIITGFWQKPFILHVYLRFLASSFMVLGLLGAVNGVLTRVLILKKPPKPFENSSAQLSI